MKTIAVTGGSGFIGSALIDFLKERGYEPITISRKKGLGIYWDPERGEIDTKALEPVDLIVHLAGENIGSLRWSFAKKRRIMDSRVKGLELLLKTNKQLIVTSATGYFGDRGNEILTATSPHGSGFLSEVCQRIEQLAAGSTICRFGIVLSSRGGMLKRLLPLVRLGFGAILGGDQYMSWIALDDLIRQLHAVIEKPPKTPLNFCSPNPITHRQFMQTLAKACHRPLFLKVPKGLIRFFLGEASQLILNSQRAVPSKAQLPLFKQADLAEALYLELTLSS